MAQPFNKQYADLNTEFYTTEETVRQLIPFLDKSKRYIEPFDRMENSQIYRVLKESGFDIIRLGKDYSKDDDYDGRIIITNPPFISRGGLYSKMSKQCEEMYLLMPVFSFNAYTKNRSKDKCRRFSDDWNKEVLFPVTEFDTPDGKKKVSCVFTYWKIKVATMSDIKCPFCQQELQEDVGYDGDYSCPNCRQPYFGSPELWQELIRTRKALDVAVDALKELKPQKAKGGGYWAVKSADAIKLINTTIEQITALEQKD